MKKISFTINVIFTLVFILLIICMGGISFCKFENFLISEKADYNEWTANLGTKTETKFSTSFFQKFNFINLNGLIRNILGQREMNGVIKLNNGYLLSPIGYVNDKTLNSYAENIAKVKDYLDENDIEFIYAVTPYTSSKYDPQLPSGVQDFGNDDIDRLCYFLREKGIEPLDFREELYKDGIDHYKMMYKTDHHWNTEMGFYAFRKLNEQVEEKLGIKTDPQITDFSNYNVTTYKNWHLGSNGQRTGVYFAGIDDFNLITPKFETCIERNGNIGTYESEIIYSTPLENKDYTSRYTYDSVLGRFTDYFENLDTKNDKKILLLTDSMGKAVAPFMIISYSKFHTVWANFNYKDIEEYRPDLVIILNYGVNAVNKNFSFIFPQE